MLQPDFQSNNTFKENRHSFYLSYDTLMTCVPILGEEQFQFLWKVIFGDFCSNWFKLFAEVHTEAAMCVKWWLQKCDLIILKSIPCLGFSNTEEFYQSWNFGCFWWNFSNNTHICCKHHNLCMTLTNVFGFLLNFLTSRKSCVKEQWPKTSLFQKFDLTSWFGQIDSWHWEGGNRVSDDIRGGPSKNPKISMI